MELASSLTSCSVAVEAVTPVDTDQAYDREVNPRSHARRPLQVEGIEILDVGPGVTSLGEDEGENRGLGLKDNRVAQLDGKLVVHITGVVVAVGIIGTVSYRSQRIVLVTAERNDIVAVSAVAGHAVAAHEEALEGRISPAPVIVAEIPEMCPCLKDQVTGKLGVEIGLESPFVVLNPLVTLLGRPFVVVNILVAAHLDRVAVGVEGTLVGTPEERERRSELQREADVRALAGEDLLIGGVTRQAYGVAYVVGCTVVENEVIGIPVVELVHLPAEGVVEDEVVVGPLEAFSDTGRETENHHFAVMAGDVPSQVGIGLAGKVGRQVKGRRLLAEEPGLDEAHGQCGIVCSAGLKAQRQGLGVSERDGPPRGFIPYAAGGEVVEVKSYGAYEGIRSPTAGEFQLAGRLFGNVVHEVHRIVLLVRKDVVTRRLIHLLGVELAHGRYFAERPLEVGLAVEISGAGENLTADNPLVGKVVAVDYDVVQSSLLALDDTHLDIDRVLLYIHLDGLDIKEEVAVVAVELGHVVIALLAAAEEPLLHRHHVIDVSLSDLQDRLQGLGRIDRVSGPGDVPEIVLAALVNVNVYAHSSVGKGIYRIAGYAGVPVTGFVVGRDDILFVVLELLGVELLAVKEVVPSLGLGLLHGAGQLEVLHVLVAAEVDVLDLDLLALVYGEIDSDGVTYYRILFNLRLHRHPGESLLLEIPGDYVAARGGDVVGEFAAAAEIEPFEKFLALAVLDAGEGPAGHPGPFLDGDAKVDGIAALRHGIGGNGYVAEISLGPQAVDDIRNVVAGDRNAGALVQARELDNLVVAEISVALDADGGDYVFPGRTV